MNLWDGKNLLVPAPSVCQPIFGSSESQMSPIYLGIPNYYSQLSDFRALIRITVRVKVIIGSLVIIENLFPPNYRYRYRLEVRMNSFNYHYRYRLGVRSHRFISIDSQLPS